jgi:hypothetical protein
MFDDDFEFRITKLKLEAGDVLVVKVDHILSEEQAQYLSDKVARIFGPQFKVLVIGKDVELSVLTMAEIEARTQ